MTTGPTTRQPLPQSPYPQMPEYPPDQLQCSEVTAVLGAETYAELVEARQERVGEGESLEGTIPL